jgi:hypothetical protein
VHLAYVLELPVEVGEVQQSFNIDKEGSFIVAYTCFLCSEIDIKKERESVWEELRRASSRVKNPTSTPPPSFPSTSKPENFPPALLEVIL